MRNASSRLSSLLPLALLGALPAQITAMVNDARSHGAVGDAVLSLDEAIQLANGSLAIAALSAQERGQLAGVSGVVSRIEIRAAVTPTITLERLLSNVIGQHHAHVHVELEGLDGPSGAPVIDGGTQAIVLPLRTNHAHVHNLVIRGGLVGVDYDTTLHYHPSEVAELGHVHIEAARDVGLRVRNPRLSGSLAPIALHEVHIHDSAAGIQVVDDSMDGNTEVYGDEVAIEACTVGIALAIDSTGGDHVLQMLRSRIGAVEHCVVMDRVTPASSSRWRLRFVHGSYRARDRAFDVDSTAGAATSFELHHLDVRSGIAATSHALIAGPQNAHFALLATECTFAGPIQIAAGTPASAIRLYNDHFTAGELSLGLAAGSADVQWSNFTAFPIGIEASTSTLPTPVTFTGCELVRSDLNDRSTGRSLLTECYLGGSVLSANVQNQRPQLTPWIGRSVVSPPDPPLGTFVDLTLDLHPGTAAVWLLGAATANPITTAAPFRFYLDLSAAVVLPGLHQLWSRVRLPIPADASLRGARLYLQPLQVPTQGQPMVPPLYLPIGGMIHIQ